jgi:chaperone BCS1
LYWEEGNLERGVLERGVKGGRMAGPASSMEFWTFWAAMLGVLSFLRNLLPKEYGHMFDTWMRRAVSRFMPYVFFDIPEFYGAGNNEIYDYVQSYLSSSTAIAAGHVNLCRPKNATQNTFSLAHHETVEDIFMDTKVWWTHEVSQRQQSGIQWGAVPNDEKRKYTLKMRKKDKSKVLDLYVQHVMDIAKSEKELSRDRLLYTNVKNGSSGYKKKAWESVPFKHPSTFDTLAMDPDLKDDIKDDLLEFTQGREFYQKAGKPWKRGYLLYGPPGTGKSSMIAAIANFLKYDIYDVELTEVSSNSELRKLLIQTTNRSVIVIEDIDCSVDLAERAKARKDASNKENNKNEGGGGGPRGKMDQDEGSRVTLSGLLNFTDGLWSCCGSERIIIFTTNHIEKLDKALLRAGRMDRHINMSWCEFPAFRTLAKNNLDLEWHDLFPEIEEAFVDKAIAPADVSEILLKNKRKPTAALQSLLEALRKAPSISEKPVVKIDFDDIPLASTIQDPDPVPVTTDVKANGSSVSPPDSNQDSEPTANGSSVRSPDSNPDSEH